MAENNSHKNILVVLFPIKFILYIKVDFFVIYKKKEASLVFIGPSFRLSTLFVYTSIWVPYIDIWQMGLI